MLRHFIIINIISFQTITTEPTGELSKRDRRVDPFQNNNVNELSDEKDKKGFPDNSPDSL
jgi:hypothetical protein